MKQKEREFHCSTEYHTLAAKLPPKELTCISHCVVFDDCAADGNCVLQDKVNSILKE